MNQQLEQRIRRVALTLAPNVDRTKCLHFSFVVKQHRIISVGWNFDWKTHPFSAKMGYRFSKIHSEVDAMRKFGLNHDYRGCTLLNIRVMRDFKSFGMAKPCPICASWLNTLQYPFKTILYTDHSGQFKQFK